MKRLTSVILAFLLSAPLAFGELPDELAQLARDKGQAGLQEIWAFLALRDSPHCRSESLKAQVKRGTSEEGSRVAVLEISDGSRNDVLFLGKEGSSWRCLRHDYNESEIDSGTIRCSWKDGLLCELSTLGRGTECHSVRLRWVLVKPHGVVDVIEFQERGYELFHQGEYQYSTKIQAPEIIESRIKFKLEFTCTVMFENQDGGCRPEDSLDVKCSATLKIDCESGLANLDCCDLGNSWEKLREFQSCSPKLVVKLRPRRVVELANSAPSSCVDFMNRCVEEGEDKRVAAEIQDVLRNRALPGGQR